MSQTRKHNKAGFESWCLPFMINDWSQIGWVRESEVPLEVALKMPQLKKNYCNINLRKKKLCWNVKVKKDLGVFKCCLEEILIKVKMSCSFRVMGIEGGYCTKAVLPGGLWWRWPMPWGGWAGSGQLLDHTVSLCLWGKPTTSLSQPLKPGNISRPKLCSDYTQALRWPAPDLPTAPLRIAFKDPQGKACQTPAAPLAFSHSVWNLLVFQRKFPQTEPGLVCEFMTCRRKISWPPQRRCPVSAAEVSMTSQWSRDRCPLGLSCPSHKLFVAVQSPSHVQLCDPTDCSTPGFPVPYYLPEFAQVHVHWISDTIQLSQSLSSSSPSAFNFSQY